MNLEVTWDTLLKIAAGLIVLFELGKWLFTFWTPIAEIRNKLTEHDKLFSNDKAHLERIDKVLVKIDNGITVLGKAINELIKHVITGNDIQELRQQQRLVNDYFYDTKRAEDED